MRKFRQDQGSSLPTGPACVRQGATADEIDIHVVVIGRPVVSEVIEESGPVGGETVDFEIAQRKGKGVVNANEGGRAVGEFRGEPFGEATARPILSRAGWRRDLGGRLARGRGVKAQSLQTAGSSLRAGVVDAKVTFEEQHGRSVQRID
jgi:hypothetical protein